jgi:hypothetical protein
VQFLHDWLCNLQLAFSLSDLHKLQLHAGQQSVHTVQHSDHGLHDLHFQLNLPDLRLGLRA